MRHRTVRFRSSSQRSPDVLCGRLFHGRSPPRLLSAAAPGGLKPTPESRLREAHSHLRYSIASFTCIRDTRQSRILVNSLSVNPASLAHPFTFLRRAGFGKLLASIHLHVLSAQSTASSKFG